MSSPSRRCMEQSILDWYLQSFLHSKAEVEFHIFFIAGCVYTHTYKYINIKYKFCFLFLPAHTKGGAGGF